ncbi:MAG: cardiolipin synthase [Epulopiscium sp.]|nr:cardiolipin synthase [Candidatus Epulonipiscium sp.]
MTDFFTVSKIIELIYILNIFLAIYVVFRERKNPTSTWAWIMIMLFVPIVGFILYLFVGHDMRKRKLFTKKEEADHFYQVLDIQEQRLLEDKNKLKDSFLYDYYNIIHLHLVSHEALYTDDNDVEIFTDGLDKFNSLFDDIKNAKDYIHIQYYIIRGDDLGRKTLNLLIDKAREGVEVKLLYDGMGCLWTPKGMFEDLIDAGGKVVCFFPPFIPYINLRVNYRNHRKICVIDGCTGYIGGFNIGQEYIGQDQKMGYWRDTHLKIRGSAVKVLDLQFLLDWRFASKEDLSFSDSYISKLLSNKDKTKAGNTGIQIVASGPDSKWPSIRNGFMKMIDLAKESIYLQTPYFIPDDSLLESLKVAALSGIDVNIMIPNKPDHPFVYWASLSYIGELLEAGARCYTYEKGFLHAKTLIVDEKICTVGTANFDIRSFKLNFEVNAFIYDQKISKKLAASFYHDISHCKELTQEIFDQRGAIVKIKESVSRLLSPML